MQTYNATRVVARFAGPAAAHSNSHAASCGSDCARARSDPLELPVSFQLAAGARGWSQLPEGPAPEALRRCLRSRLRAGSAGEAAGASAAIPDLQAAIPAWETASLHYADREGLRAALVACVGGGAVEVYADEPRAWGPRDAGALLAFAQEARPAPALASAPAPPPRPSRPADGARTRRPVAARAEEAALFEAAAAALAALVPADWTRVRSLASHGAADAALVSRRPEPPPAVPGAELRREVAAGPGGPPAAAVAALSAGPRAWSAEDRERLDAVAALLGAGLTLRAARRREREQLAGGGQLHGREAELRAALARSAARARIVAAANSSLETGVVLQAAADAIGESLRSSRSARPAPPAPPAAHREQGLPESTPLSKLMEENPFMRRRREEASRASLADPFAFSVQRLDAVLPEEDPASPAFVSFCSVLRDGGMGLCLTQGVPYRNELIGGITEFVDSSEGGTETLEEHAKFFADVAGELAAALAHARAHARLQARPAPPRPSFLPGRSLGPTVARPQEALARARFLCAVTEAVRRSLDTGPVLEAAASALGPALRADRVVLRSFAEGGAGRTEALAEHLSERARAAGQVPLAQALPDLAAVDALYAESRFAGPMAALLERGACDEPLAVEDARPARPPAPGPAPPTPRRAFLAHTIAYGGEVMGTVEVFSREGRRWGGAERELLRELARQNAELVEARTAAEAAARAKANFLAVVTHELRTPMQSVLGLGRLLLDTPLDATQRGYLETMLASGGALVDLVSQILGPPRPPARPAPAADAGRAAVEAAPFALRELVEGVTDLLAPAAAGKGLELALYVPPRCPRLLSDARRLRQILINLVGNAIKFTAKGGVALVAECGPAGPDGRWPLRLTVADTGCGIRPEDRAKLFGFFSQLDQTRTRHFEGTGIGLFLSQNLARLLGGELSVESAGAGCGSAFTVALSLPAAPEPGAGPGPEVPEGPAAALAGRRCIVAVANDTRRRYLRDQAPPPRPPRPAPPAPPRPAEAPAGSWWQWPAAALPAALIADAPAPAGLDLAAAPHLRCLLLTRPAALPGPGGPAAPGPAPAAPTPAPRAAGPSASLREARPGPGPPAGPGEPAPRVATLQLPLAQAKLFRALAALLAPEGGAQAPAPAPATPPAGAPGPHPMNRKIVLLMLKKLGYEGVDAVENGAEAVAAVGRKGYDVVLMDWMMPMLTANAGREDREACAAAGTDGFLAKPVKLEELADALANTGARLQSVDAPQGPGC
eukprot:tig00000093_g3462.t1